MNLVNVVNVLKGFYFHCLRPGHSYLAITKYLRTQGKARETQRNGVAEGVFNKKGFSMQLMTVKEAREYLKKSKSAFYRDLNKGVIPAVKIGNKTLIVKDKIDAQIKRQLANARKFFN